MKITLITLILLGLASLSSMSFSATCKIEKLETERTPEDLANLYACIRPELIENYGKKNHNVGVAYTKWKRASKYPAAPGVHSQRYLMTYVNDVGYNQYIQYNTDGASMPLGTVIAKESFQIKKNGKIKKGPLFIMTKVGDKASDQGGWQYSGVQANGKTLKTDEGFCHSCHQAWATQDYQGYPVPNARVTN